MTSDTIYFHKISWGRINFYVFSLISNALNLLSGLSGQHCLHEIELLLRKKSFLPILKLIHTKLTICIRTSKQFFVLCLELESSFMFS